MKKRKFLKFSNNIYGKKAVFNEHLFNKYDIPARKKLINALGEYLSDNPDKFGQDLIINSDTCKYKFLEVQVCADWIAPDFPKKYLYIYERKKRYGKDTLFITLNRWMTKAFIFDTQVLVNDKPRRIRKYSREFIYEIPWNRALNVFIEHINKNSIEWY